ncbi:hypothetical protein RD792_010260 [Penstemon davidsonii]|uniref:Clp R domain-containing protein n=1 Tax=Penstemon davidsonii TaxID=160366 RepID=A0ABR0D366_9LAMI|nr:hypothetical protein RD792_010260 [Penstemon davidsonii]
MPTPVSVARQCLAEAAAVALDEAVNVAKKRCHAQTTSLHAVSALLSLPSSTLREACTRARSSAYSPRLQFRALELCVGAALDRVSVSKSSASEEPPVSNSLMAAIKRAQANQRRHPETFHLYQQQLNSNLNSSFQNSISVVKVELKHFVMSILDDPIVGRVFADAGFRTNEIKLAILNPIPMSSATSRYPPPFFGRLNDLEANKLGPNFPFHVAAATEKVDENSRRIGEILVNKNNRNPLLIGGCANEVLRSFTDCLKRNEKTEFLPKEIEGLSVVSMEPEISEFVNEERIRLKLKQASEMVENCRGSGILVNCGDLKAFVDIESVDIVNSVVSELKRLLINSGGKLWVIGFLANDDDYKKLLERFPSIENDWDLHLLPITTSSIGGKCFKSSLMGSFVPFGGFFSFPSELETLRTSGTQSSSLCNFCNEKYEKEISVIQKGESTGSIADKHSVNPASWLQIATSKRPYTVEARDDKALFDAKVMALKTKWSDICRRLHFSGTSQEDIFKAKSQSFTVSSAGLGTLLNGSRTNLSPCTPADLQKNFLSDQNIPIPQAELPVHGSDINDRCNPSISKGTTNLPIACTSPPSVVSVTTDLGLGTIYVSAEECRRKTNLQDHNISIRDSLESSGHNENTSSRISQSPSSSHRFSKEMGMKDLEYPWKVLAEKVSWQIEAIRTIGRTILRCKNGNGSCHFSNKGNIWLSFLGPDKVTKRKVAATIAEIVCGKQENLLCFDLSLQDSICPVNSIIDSSGLEFQDLKSGRKMIVDYIAEELSKHPNSVILLENIEKADFFVQSSLSQAVKTGKFQDSHGRDINVKNIVFVLASSVLNFGKSLPFGRVESEFPEEKILEAKNLQMQILIRYVHGDYSPESTANVSIIPSKTFSNQVKKRKLMDAESTKAEISKRSSQLPRSIIDLNLPVEDTEEDSNIDTCDDDPEMWLKEFLELVDENVEFRPFDFESLAKKILKEIDVGLRKVVNTKILLEIDREVMAQILAAAWLADSKNALEDWIETVLCSSVEEARLKCNVTSSDCVMQLVPCDGLVVEERASGVCLPARINVI